MDPQYREINPGVTGVPIGTTTTRAQFISRTYTHLFFAILGFTLIEVFLFRAGLALPIAKGMLSVNWLFVLGGFMVVSWLATRAAHNVASVPLQYLALAGFVVAEALLFVPILVIAEISAPGVIKSAALVTLIGFAGLTAVAFWSRQDFTFMRGLLRWGGVVALVAIAGGAIFGFTLGTWFSAAMIAFAGVAILHDTSNVIRHFPEDRYVAAALELFASVALMFWYVLRLFLSRR